MSEPLLDARKAPEVFCSPDAGDVEPLHVSQATGLDSGREDFRDHLATADVKGRRRWVYAKKPSGRWHTRRLRLSWLLIALMFAGPFIRIHGNPLLMMNIVERRFSILGQLFWPQDIVIFAVALLVFLTGIIIFTTGFGRLWCGWVCPQTVMMEMVFRRLEYLIEGSAQEQRALNAAPWTGKKLARKVAKHAVFFALSFIIGNTLLSYIIGSDQLLPIVSDNPLRHATGLTFMMFFTLLFYANFARFREQACTFICPYGRFQSALLDENTMVVAYDYKRGESRSPRHGAAVSFEQRRAAGLGDCIDCHQCVAVCPTGIDIRNGTQMECVNCTACIDACDSIMEKIARPAGLIRFASLNSIEKGELLRFTPRMKAYLGVLVALIGLFVFLVFTRADVEATLLRAPGSLFQQTPEGQIQNLYTLKIINKAMRDIPLDLKLENLKGTVRIMGSGTLLVPEAQMAQTSILIEIPPALLHSGSTQLELGLYSRGTRLQLIRTAFAGPRTNPL